MMLQTQKTVQLKPRHTFPVHALGMVYYRAGRWREAFSALENAREMMETSPRVWDTKVCNWFFLAMAHWQLNDKQAARRWYEKGDAWMQKNQPKDDDLRRVQAEAAKLLGVDEKSALGPQGTEKP